MSIERVNLTLKYLDRATFTGIIEAREFASVINFMNEITLQLRNDEILRLQQIADEEILQRAEKMSIATETKANSF